MSSPIPSFALTWGCQMLAFIFDLCLYGIAMLLVGQYFRSHTSSKDSIAIKSTVGVLCFLSTLHITFLCHQVYTDFVIRFGDFEGLDLAPFSATAQLVTIYVLSFVAQLFFAARIWIITKGNIFYTLPVVLLALLQIGAGLAQSIIVASTIIRYSGLSATARITSTQSAATAACDVLITVILCLILHGSRSGIKRTDGIINRLIVYAINRGVATSLCALLNLAFFLGKPGTFVFMIFLEPSSQLYVITVVSMLKNRKSLRDGFDTGAETMSNIGMTNISLESQQGTEDPGNGILVQKQDLSWRELEA